MDDPESSFRWLVKREIDYHYSVFVMVEQMHAAAAAKNQRAAFYLTEELRFLGDMMGDALERALIRMECSRALFKLGDPEEAAEEIIQAIDLLEPSVNETIDHKHYYAVAMWMLGSLLRKSKDRRTEALVAWQRSLDAFQTLVYHADTLPPDNTWYKARCLEMYGAIENSIRRNFTTGLRGAARKAKPKIDRGPAATLYPGGHGSIPVIGIIPAGGFGPTGLGPHTIEQLTLEPAMVRFKIGKSTHKMYNLRGPSRTITLGASKTYFILKVSGDSMNKANIDPGDYVLMLSQPDGDSGDIVAAEIEDEVVEGEKQATLKLLLKNDQVIALRPKSSNPVYPVFRFVGTRKGFHIRGVAIAVLKPVN